MILIFEQIKFKFYENLECINVNYVIWDEKSLHGSITSIEGRFGLLHDSI